ncbi:MAG TPA: hypothetical protein VGF99_22125, partial [Myxococcota bacterium]
ETVPSPTRANPDADPVIAAVVMKALHKNRDDRFASAAEFRDALEDAMHATGARFRPVETRELMTRLFADVITRQRAVLEATLNAVDDNHVVPADTDDEATAGQPGDSESVSDLRMPRLGITVSGAVDTATPSAVTRRSPLVTAEGDPAGPLAPPIDARSRSKTPSTASALARPRRITDPATSVPTAVLPMPTSPPAASSVLAPPLDGPSTIAEAPTPSSRRWGVPLLAAFLGLVVAIGIVALVRAVVDDSEDVVVADAGAAPTVVVDAVVDAGAAIVVDAGAVELVDAGSDVVDEELPETDPDETEPKRPTNRPRRRPPPPVVVEAPVVEEQGFLTLDTLPWTTVYLGKKKLGETPLVKVVVPAGTIELTLVNSEAGIKEAYVARITAGEVFRTRLDLR